MPDVHLADTALALYHTLDTTHWQRSFDARSLSRGLAYARQGKVCEGSRLERQGELLVLRAQVNGSGRSRYLTSVAVDPYSPDMGVVSDCSCPVGRQCKHAAAVIRSFLDDMEAKGMAAQDDTASLKQRWESWLAELEAPSGASMAAEQLEEDYRLALFLDIDPNPRSPTLKVSPVWMRPSKQRSRGNGWVKPRPIMVRRGGSLLPKPPQGLAPDQEEALELLMLGEQRRQLAGGTSNIGAWLPTPFRRERSGRCWRVIHRRYSSTPSRRVPCSIRARPVV